MGLMEHSSRVPVTPAASSACAPRTQTPFLGLAPFLRMSIAGVDLKPVAQQLLDQLAGDASDANLLMNLAIVAQCLGQRELGLQWQQQALTRQRVFHLAATQQPPRLRLLMLMQPGDLAANTPLECLLEQGDVDLDFYYVSPGVPLAWPMPEHDALIVAMSECDASREPLAALQRELRDWPRPVINAPQHIPSTGRAAASALLQGLEGLLMPPTWRASGKLLQSIAAGGARLNEVFDDGNFPVIVRPVGSHGGHDLAKVDDAAAMASYLERVPDAQFYVSPFIDYRDADGWFRKIRVALIDGEPFACHMAVSSHWMIHYVNAGMYEESWKREEEARFMTHFNAFATRHRLALQAIWERTGLDYVCIDCAQTVDGQLLVFEIDHAMVVHAMDLESLFPYKQTHMHKVKAAMRELLLRRTQASSPHQPNLNVPCKNPIV